MQTHLSEPLNKRLVFVTGDKGGVGKSFMALTLVQHIFRRRLRKPVLQRSVIDQARGDFGGGDTSTKLARRNFTIAVIVNAHSLKLPSIFWEAILRDEQETGSRIIIGTIHEVTPQAAKWNENDSFAGRTFPYFQVAALTWDGESVSGSLALTPLDSTCPVRVLNVPFYLDFMGESIEFALPAMAPYL